MSDIKFEFFFDCSSPWTYMAFHNVQPVAAEFGVDIIWRPMLVGGVFNAINQDIYEARANPVPQKGAYMRKDLDDWAKRSHVTINWPSIFPVNSVKAMRGCFIAIEEGKLVPFATKVCEAYWGEDKDISDDAIIAEIVEAVGLNQTSFFERIGQQATKDRLKDNTQEVMDRGGFGSPTMFINDTDMYFGNDRLPLVRDVFEQLTRQR